MRSTSLLAAVATLLLAAALVARSSRAEPPPPSEARDIKKVIAALKAKPALKAELASVRWAAEVVGVTQVSAPVGSSLETLGPWGDNETLLGVETGCAPLDEKQLAAAGALLKEYGDALPVLLRAHVLGQQGKPDEAAELFSRFVTTQLPPGECPGEHPMYSHRRTGRMSRALQCLERFAPKRDLSKEKAALRRAESCAANNHAVG